MAPNPAHPHMTGKRKNIPISMFAILLNKAGYTATLVACGWAGAVLEKVTRASGQEPYAQKAQKRQKSNRSPKGNMWSVIPVALLCMLVIVDDG